MTEKQCKLVNDNLGLVGSIAKKYKNMSHLLDADDLFQVGCEGLIHAALHYREKKGGNFATYAYGCIDGYIKKELDDYGRMVPIPQYLSLLHNQWKKETEDVPFVNYAISKGHKNSQALQAYFATLPVVYLDQAVPSAEDNFDKYVDFLPDNSSIGNTEVAVYYQYVKNCIQELFTNYHDYNLKKQEVEILKKRFGFDSEPMKLKEIAIQYGVSGEYVRQLEKKALNKIKNQIDLHLNDCLEACDEFDFSDYA